MAPAVLAGLPRTGDAPAGPAHRERSGKVAPGLARDLGRELNVATSFGDANSLYAAISAGDRVISVRSARPVMTR